MSRAYQALSEQPPSSKSKKTKTKHEVDQLRVSLETQVRVCQQLEGERDRSNDEYEFAMARLHTVLKQQQQLMHAAGEMGRERDRALAEVDILRQQLVGMERRGSGLKDTESSGPSSNKSSLFKEPSGLCLRCNKCDADRPASSPGGWSLNVTMTTATTCVCLLFQSCLLQTETSFCCLGTRLPGFRAGFATWREKRRSLDWKWSHVWSSSVSTSRTLTRPTKVSENVWTAFLC